MTYFIRNELLQNDFYQKSMSLLLRGSPGIPERIEAWVSVLFNVNLVGRQLFSAIDVFDLYWFPVFGRCSGVWLDLIGEILGIKREVNCKIWFVNGKLQTDAKYGIVNLTDDDFRYYIQAQIRKFNFDGTRSALREAYRNSSMLNFDVLYDNINKYYPEVRSYLKKMRESNPLADLQITYADGDSPAECKIYLNNNDISDNLKNLFVNGHLTIESVGIEYEYYIGSERVNGRFYEKSTYAGTEAKFFAQGAFPYAVFYSEALKKEETTT